MPFSPTSSSFSLEYFHKLIVMVSQGLSFWKYHYYFRCDLGRDPLNQNSNRSDREKWSTSKGRPVFSKLFWLDRTDPLSFGRNFRKFWLNGLRPLCLITNSDWQPANYTLHTNPTLGYLQLGVTKSTLRDQSGHHSTKPPEVERQ